MEQLDPLLNLTRQDAIEIGLTLSLVDVYNLCQTNSMLNRALCENDDFWQQKYLYDYGQPKKTPSNWHDAYQRKYNPQTLIGIRQGLSYQVHPLNIPDIIQIVCIHHYILFLDRHGKVWTSTTLSQLPKSEDLNEATWDLEEVKGLPPIVQMSNGIFYLLFLDDNGEVWEFQHTSYDTSVNITSSLSSGSFTPKKVPQLNNIIQVSVGVSHRLALDIDGQVWGWGNNKYGQLGIGQTDASVEYVIKEGVLFAKVLSEVPMTKILGLDNIVQISVGNYHSLFLDQDGQVFSTGRNDYGQLGTGDLENRYVPTELSLALPRIKQISAGDVRSFILTEDGEVSTFGLSYGIPIKITHPTLVDGMSNIKKISAQMENMVALTGTGKVYLHKTNDRDRDPDLLDVSMVQDISACNSIILFIVKGWSPFSLIDTLIENDELTSAELIGQIDDSNYEFIFRSLNGELYRAKMSYNPDTGRIDRPN